ncbi:MAG: sterol desaturase family protein [Planctomycetaceae bacterium]|nr:sterol desaturase family protein [Planctomycetaceae bacterium]
MTTANEVTVRFLAFAGVLVVMGLWEWLAPRRPRVARTWLRWSSHSGLVAVNNLLVRFALPLTALQTAEMARDWHWGVLALVDWPAWLEAAIAIVALDFVIYWQHVLFHRVPLFWRLHRVHHADLDLDVTSGVRFHTLEILLSMLLKCGAVAILGAAPLAVVAFEVILNATSMFNHSNVRMPLGLDRWLRWFVVTPDMHRVHHSVIPRETNSNYGFNLPLWDRVFGTYRPQPEEGHLGMSIGLSDERDEIRCERLDWILALPFARQTEGEDERRG